MPDLIHSLQPYDLGHLRIVASLWGIELASPDPQTALEELVGGMLEASSLKEIVETLSVEAHQALQTLVLANGRIPWGEFSRRFGAIRDAGPGRRDREMIFLHPISATEILFYRALMDRAFFETSTGPQEFAYIPEDLLALLMVKVKEPEPVPGHQASPLERAYPTPASDRILDDICTFLAGKRMGWVRLPEGVTLSVPQKVLQEFLLAADLLPPEMVPGSESREGIPATQIEAIKNFLELPRAEALAWLTRKWLDSKVFNELHQVPDLVCEGTWKNDSHATRYFLLNLLGRIPPGKWWSLPSLIAMVRENHPDFERPAGDFDSWLIRRESDDAFMHGFDHWEDVEGSLIRYFIAGPLHWLGMVDLASPKPGEPGVVERITAFRLNAWLTTLMKRKTPTGSSQENGKLHVGANGLISAPVQLPRSVRYQLARFCEWETEKQEEYRYRLTPASLKAALSQGLKVSHLLSLLKKYSASPLPPSFVRALVRWELNGTEARLEQPLVLRLSRPEVLEELRRSRAGRFLGEVLGPTTVVVKPGAQSKILASLGELGLLADEGIKTDIISDGESHHK